MPRVEVPGSSTSDDGHAHLSAASLAGSGDAVGTLGPEITGRSSRPLAEELGVNKLVSLRFVQAIRWDGTVRAGCSAPIWIDLVVKIGTMEPKPYATLCRRDFVPQNYGSRAQDCNSGRSEPVNSQGCVTLFPGDGTPSGAKGE